MEVALAGGAVTERAKGHRPLAFELGGVRDSGRLRNPARDDLGNRCDLQTAVAVAAARDVAPRRQRIVGFGENRQHPLLHGQPADDRVGKGAVVRNQPVVRPKRRCGRDLDSFVASARADKRRSPLLDQDVHAIVQSLGHAHPAMHLDVFGLGPGRRCDPRFRRHPAQSSVLLRGLGRKSPDRRPSSREHSRDFVAGTPEVRACR